VLATSREVLGILGETIWRVDPLGIPDLEKVAAGTACESDSVLLFVERASAALPESVLSDGNAASIPEICRRLDGLPLGLELTAARLRVLSVDDIAQ
jgi:predicted ATPase